MPMRRQVELGIPWGVHVSHCAKQRNRRHDTCGIREPLRSRAALLLRGRGAEGVDSYVSVMATGSECGERLTRVRPVTTPCSRCELSGASNVHELRLQR
jgi:hypothetical protein